MHAEDQDQLSDSRNAYLNLAQKRIIRCIADAEYNAHTSLLFKKYQLLKFEDIVEYVLCIHMYKSIKAHKYSPARRANTRNQNEIKSSFHRLTMCQQATSYTGPHSWNRLSEALKQIKTIET